MAVELASLDIRCVVKELQVLVGGRIQKVYQTGRTFLFEIYTGTDTYWLRIDGSSVYLTEHKQTEPVPPAFCMFLRKHLLGQRVRSIGQHGFDRVVEIKTDNYTLIAELFGGGNLILCDSSYRIIMPMQVQRWADRQVRPGQTYTWPAGPANPFELSASELQALAVTSSKSLGAWLAVDLGFGPVYSREICFRADTDPARPANSVDVSKIVTVIKGFQYRPCLYPDMISAMVLKSDSRPYKEMASLSAALDKLAELAEAKEERPEERAIEEKAARIVAQQEKARQKWQEKEQTARRAAQLIYSHWAELEGVINQIAEARKTGQGWADIRAGLRPPAKEINEAKALLTAEIEGQNIDIDLRKPLTATAAKYFEAAKRAKAKWAGAVAAQAEYAQKIAQLREQAKAKKAKPIKKVRRRWYERFRWFVSSDSFLIVAGKDASQNEQLVKRRLAPEDLVCHADIHGAAFVAIKAEGKQIGERAKKEAAQFAAAHSKAWSAGLGTVDVFCVRPEQISKPPGLPKGAFAVTGPRQWFKEMEVRLTVGIVLDKQTQTSSPIAGPVMAVKAKTGYFVTIQPGTKPASELAAEIKRQILVKALPEDKPLLERAAIDDIARLIPAGSGDIMSK